jgi:predicted DNA binding CopG/RHH family protein
MNKKIPHFQSDEEAEAFVAEDISDYITAENFKRVRFEFLPKDTKINMRLPLSLLENIKQVAEKQGISYQKYIRMTLEQATQRGL